jgi:hypothetical protein
MKYMFNVPLAVAALLHAWFISLVLMPGAWSGWGDGPSRGAMAFVMLQPVLLSWLLLAPVVIGAVFAGGFGWLRVHRRWLQLTVALGLWLLIAILTVPCIAIAIGISAAVSDSDSLAFGPLAKGSSLLVATLGPLILMAWLAWVINAPPAKRGAIIPGAAGLAVLLATVLTGGILGTGMLAAEIAIERATAARDQQTVDERNVAVHSGFAKLTDADPLWKWAGYTDRFAPEDVRQPALRRLAARPTLEPDLIAALAAPDSGSPDAAVDSERAFLLPAAIPFEPSAALGEPLRARIARLAQEIRVLRQPGSSNDFDDYVDSWYEERLAAALVISKKIAESAGVDLSGALRDLQSAVVEAYPKSKSAKTYPGQVAATTKQIEAILAARPKQK